MILLASLPILGLVIIRMYKSSFNFHLIRWLGIGSILFVLLISGLIVSVKIGGGNNIHNLDAYLFILLIVGSYVYFDKMVTDYSHKERAISQNIVQVFIALGIIIPMIFTLQGGKPFSFTNSIKIDKALNSIRETTSHVTNNGGKILFISERQLLTFNDVVDVPLEPDYERMTLMEMAMGGNEAYLNEFHRRIANQEFALIISEPLKLNYKGRSQQFGEENDVYVYWVSEPVLCYYEPVKTISKFAVQLLMPREELDNCP